MYNSGSSYVNTQNPDIHSSVAHIHAYVQSRVLIKGSKVFMSSIITCICIKIIMYVYAVLCTCILSRVDIGIAN